MPLTDAIIQNDIAAIFTDLRGSSVVETVGRIRPDETEASATFEIVRARQRTAEELQDTGMETLYRFSIYPQRAYTDNTNEGDILVMANGERLRVFNITEEPSRVLQRFDLGDEFEDGNSI